MLHFDLRYLALYGLRLSNRFPHTERWIPDPYPPRIGSAPLPPGVNVLDLATGQTRLGRWVAHDLRKPFGPDAFMRRPHRRRWG